LAIGIVRKFQLDDEERDVSQATAYLLYIALGITLKRIANFSVLYMSVQKHEIPRQDVPVTVEV